MPSGTLFTATPVCPLRGSRQISLHWSAAGVSVRVENQKQWAYVEGSNTRDTMWGKLLRKLCSLPNAHCVQFLDVSMIMYGLTFSRWNRNPQAVGSVFPATIHWIAFVHRTILHWTKSQHKSTSVILSQQLYFLKHQWQKSNVWNFKRTVSSPWEFDTRRSPPCCKGHTLC